MLTPCQAVAQPANQPPYKVSLSSFWEGSKSALVRIDVSDDPTPAHIPSAIVLVLDESGSMGDAAVCSDDTDGSFGLSQVWISDKKGVSPSRPKTATDVLTFSPTLRLHYW